MIPNEIQILLQDRSVTDICFQSGFLSADRGEGMEVLSPPCWSEDEIRNWVLQELSQGGKAFDARHPFVDAVLTPSAQTSFEHRMHVVFPPISGKRIHISLRKLPSSERQRFWQEDPAFPILRRLVQNGETLLLSGSTGSGKTTLASELLSEISERERIIALEDTPELAPQHPQFLRMVSRTANADGYGEVTLRTLLRQTLRMRPDRIVLGECRGPEVLDLLQLLNTGHRGTLATLHANSPREALRRIELLCLLSPGNPLPIPTIRELLALGIQWIAQVERTPEGRKIRELIQIAGREGDTLLLRNQPLLPSNPGDDLFRSRTRLA